MTRPQAATDVHPTSQALVDLVVRGMWIGSPTPELKALVDDGLALVKGSVVLPGPGAEAAVRQVLRLPAGSGTEAQVSALYEAFLPINARLRDICTAWQRRPDGSANDHQDLEYDAGVRDDLDDVHEAVAPILRRLGKAVPRLARFPVLLQAALDRLDDGNPAWFTSPMCDSYHTVWMHLHQELILALGIDRAEDTARERLAVGGAG
ncbi:hypothetical protein [Nonomuraea sp. NPDC049480]|uniref:hypothetical protein n=1 Tax=Nonomuraea sp. NPDC049480 TaxID=3364353 RepID=UPI0037B0DB1F